MKKTLAGLLLLGGVYATPAYAQTGKNHYYRIEQGRPEFKTTNSRPNGQGWREAQPRTVTIELTLVPEKRTHWAADTTTDLPPGQPDPTGPVVAVIDTGIDETHSWFTGRLLQGAVFHNDGAGLADLNGHGTHVAGIIARENPAARILPIRALDRYGLGDDYNLARAVTWAVDNGAAVINMSLGAPWQLGDAYLAALRYAEERQVVVVAASGNDGPNGGTHYPAAYPEVLAVTAIGADATEPEFAQRGEHIDIAAPGVSVLSAVPGGTGRMSGTSMAAPMVSAVVSALRALHPDWTAADLRDHITATAEDIGRPGRDNIFGAGALNSTRAKTLDGPLRSSTTTTSKYLLKKVPGGVRIGALPWQPYHISVTAQRPDGITRLVDARTGWRLLYDEPGEYRVHSYDRSGRLLGWETVLLTEPGGAPAVQVKPSLRRAGRIALRSGNHKTRTITLWEIVDKRFVRRIASVETGHRWTTVQTPRTDFIACYEGINGQPFGCHKTLYKQPAPIEAWPLNPAEQ